MKTFFFLCAVVCSFNLAFGQNVEPDSTSKDQLYVVTKNDGREYIGKILSDDGREILIETEILGKIYIPKSEIISIIKVQDQKEIVYGEYQSTGPFTTRYAFTTNALPIKKGENYALLNIWGPEVHFALTDHLNVGVMSTWAASPMILALKYSFKTKNEKINFSIGTLMGTSGYFNTFRGFGGLHFANITMGSRKKNLTLSGGYAYMKDGSYSSYFEPGTYITNGSALYYNYGDQKLVSPMQQGPIFSIAGIIPVGAKASFVFDSMVGFFSSQKNVVTTTTLIPDASYQDPNPPYTYYNIPGTYQHDVVNVRTESNALFLMPGMRFQTKENRAFQVALAGVAVFRTKGYTGSNPNYSLPIPMCTWFFRF
jgi:hypothetical protein